MSQLIRLALVSLLAALAIAAQAQPLPVPYPTPDNPGDDIFTTTYVRLGPDTDGLLVEPLERGPNASIAMVFSHPNSDNFGERPGWYMARRGYPVMLVNYRGNSSMDEPYLRSISLGIAYMRRMSDISTVVLLTHSGGGTLGALYQNVAENGPSACQGPEKIYPCSGENLDDLEAADGVVFLDSTLGAAHRATAVDPAVTDSGRNPGLDMFSEANGFSVTGKSNYSDDFARRYYEAQSARNNSIINDALGRLDQLRERQDGFPDDEAMIIKGIGRQAMGARLYQPDPDFQARTRSPHLLLRADGTEEQVIIESVREPVDWLRRNPNLVHNMDANTTVRDFLANMAVRTTPEFAMTADDIIGVDWGSSYTSAPSNAEGITVPALVLTMGCHYLIVPGEIIYEHLSSSDKTYASVEGATHGFYPCRDEYGDTVARTFDFVDRWTREDGRFQSHNH